MVGISVGFVMAAGLILIAASVAVRRRKSETTAQAAVAVSARAAAVAARRRRLAVRARLRQRLTGRDMVPVVVAAAVGAGGLVVTRWPVVGLGGAVIGWIVAVTLTGSGAGNVAARAEAVAVWVETMRDLVAGGQGLESAVLTACRSAPKVLAADMARVVLEVDRGRSVKESIAASAGWIANPTADIAIAVVVLTLDGNASRPIAVLDQLAQEARAQVARIAEVEAARASARTTMRMIMAVLALGVGAMFVFGRGYLDAYGTLIGQLVLGVILAIMAVAFGWMRTLITIKEDTRVLTPETMT